MITLCYYYPGVSYERTGFHYDLTPGLDVKPSIHLNILQINYEHRNPWKTMTNPQQDHPPSGSYRCWATNHFNKWW